MLKAFLSEIKLIAYIPAIDASDREISFFEEKVCYYRDRGEQGLWWS